MSGFHSSIGIHGTLAERISQAPAVLFVDALMPDGKTSYSTSAGQPRLEPLQSATGGDPAMITVAPPLISPSVAVTLKVPPVDPDR